MLARVPEALDEVGPGAGWSGHRTTKLSGGQQQRLALAGVLAPRPGILVLDEPTANLDPPAARAFAARLAALRRSRAVTIVIVEHRVDVAWPIADRVLALGPDGSRSTSGGRPTSSRDRASRLVAAGAWLPDDDGPRRRPCPPACRAGRRAGRCVTAQRRLVRLRRPDRRPRRRLRPHAGRAGRAGRHQRLGQVDAGQAPRRASCDPRDGRGLPRRLGAGRPRAGRPRRARRLRVPGPRAAVRPAARRRGGDARARRRGAPPGGGPDGPHRPPARPVRPAQPVHAVRRRAAAAVARVRARPATRRCSSSTSRPTARTATATRRCSRSSPPTSATGPPCWPRPTTSASSRTSPAGSSGSRRGRIVHVELAEGGLTTAEIVA